MSTGIVSVTPRSTTGGPMRRHITAAAAPRRWRRRRAARIALAVALVLLAPFAGRSDPDGAEDADLTAADGNVHAGISAASHTDGALAGTPGAAAGSEGPSPTAPGDIRVVPVPLADPGVAGLLRPGDLVDLVSAAEISSDPAVDMLVARAARVREIPEGRPGSRSILVEVPQPEAARIAAIAAGTPLAVIVHG